MQKLPFKFNDGGRAKAGYSLSPDCVARAIAIVEEMPYLDAVRLIRDKLLMNKGMYTARQLSAVHGIPQYITEWVMRGLGYKYIETPGVCFRSRQGLPKGRIVIRVRGHVAAVINGVLNDSWDCQKTGRRPLLGYWSK